jgi:hypothetical protein
MDFPKIIDFSEIDTVPTKLLDLYDHQVHDVRKQGQTITPLSIDARSIIQDKYSRILRIIDSTWGSQELQNKFTKWLLTDQEGRLGWPKAVYEALLQLSNEHAMRFNLEGEVIWQDNPDRW